MTQERWGVRELLAAGLAWLAGLAVLHRCERLPSRWEFIALVLTGVLLVALRRRHWLALAGAVAVLAFLQGAWRAELRLAPELHPAWEGRDLELTGRVDSLPVAVTGQGGVSGWRFEFAVASLGPTGAALPPTVPPQLMLLAYGDEQGGEAPAITSGERWRFTVRLKRAHGLANPGGFDAELWLFEQGLRATGVVRGAQRLQAAPWWEIDALRQRLRSAIRQRVADPELAGVLAALSLGDQNAIVVSGNKVVS